MKGPAHSAFTAISHHRGEVGQPVRIGLLSATLLAEDAELADPHGLVPPRNVFEMRRQQGLALGPVDADRGGTSRRRSASPAARSAGSPHGGPRCPGRSARGSGRPLGSPCRPAGRTGACPDHDSPAVLGSLKMSAATTSWLRAYLRASIRPGGGVPCLRIARPAGPGAASEKRAFSALRSRRVWPREQPDRQAAALAPARLGVLERGRQIVRVHVEDNGDASRGEPPDRIVDRRQVLPIPRGPPRGGRIRLHVRPGDSQAHGVEAKPPEIVELRVRHRQVPVAAGVRVRSACCCPIR